MRSKIFVGAAAAMLWAAPAWADHCDGDVADVDWGLASASGLNPNAVDAAAALREHAVAVCAAEEEEIASAGADAPLADPDYVTMGKAVLLDAKRLLGIE